MVPYQSMDKELNQFLVELLATMQGETNELERRAVRLFFDQDSDLSDTLLRRIFRSRGFQSIPTTGGVDITYSVDVSEEVVTLVSVEDFRRICSSDEQSN